MFTSFAVLPVLGVTLLAARWPNRLARQAVLVVASLILYGTVGTSDLGWLIVVIAASYGAGLAVERTRSGLILVMLVAAVVLPLVTIKYVPWFLDVTRSSSGTNAMVGAAAGRRGIPPGLSFVTLQAIGYVLDVRRGVIPATTGPLRHTLFLSFFPQLVAGPIERAAHLLPQLDRPHLPTTNEYYRTAKLALWGYAAKLVIANQLAAGIDRLGMLPLAATAGGIAVILLLFSVQLYFDFYGYSCIAVALGAAHGVRLLDNFNHPYAAASAAEFWRRWHVSLSAWLRDYIYLPLGGSRRGTRRRIGATFATFLVSGLWHGAGWAFLGWGAAHAALVIVSPAWARNSALVDEPHSESWIARFAIPHLVRFGGITTTFMAVSLLWLPFVAPTDQAVLSMLRTLAGGVHDVPQFGTDFVAAAWHAAVVAALAALALAADPWIRRQADADLPAGRWAVARDLAMVDALAVALFLLGDFGPREFIYFRF